MAGKKKFVKPNAAEMHLRLDIVEEQLLKGLSIRQIRAYLSKMKNNPVELSEKQIGRYVAKINKKWDKAKEPYREREFVKAKKRLEHILSGSLMIQDFKNAGKVAWLIVQLLGLDTMHKGTGEKDGDQFDRLVSALETRYQENKK